VLTSGATANDAGQLHLSFVNVDLNDTRDVTVTINGATAGYVVESAQLITGQAKDSFNDFGRAEAVNIQTLPDTSYQICAKKLKVTLPSKSIVMLTLDPL
jgi:alpha-L-arabinofuranosidase